MSVCCNCVKTTCDSKEKNDKTMFLNISDSYIKYDIFDLDQSIVESNSYEDCIDISSKISAMKIK